MQLDKLLSSERHYQKVCRKKLQNQKRRTVNNMDDYQIYGTVNNEDTNDSDCDYLFGIQENKNVNTVKSQQPKLNLTINGLLWTIS